MGGVDVISVRRPALNLNGCFVYTHWGPRLVFVCVSLTLSSRSVYLTLFFIDKVCAVRVCESQAATREYVASAARRQLAEEIAMSAALLLWCAACTRSTVCVRGSSFSLRKRRRRHYRSSCTGVGARGDSLRPHGCDIFVLEMLTPHFVCCVCVCIQFCIIINARGAWL